MKLRQINGFIVYPEIVAAVIDIFDDDLSVGSQAGDGPGNRLRRHAQNLTALFNQRLVRKIDMPLFSKLLQLVQDTGFDSWPAVIFKSEFFGNAVGF